MANLTKNFIPRPDGDFDDWQKNFVTISTSNATTWGVPTTEITALTTNQIQWIASYAVGGKGQKTLRTSQQTKAKTVARKTYEKNLRIFIRRWISVNPAVSDAQRVALRVTIANNVRSTINKPIFTPNVEITPTKGNTLVFHFKQEADGSGKSHRGKPVNTHGMKIYYKIEGTAPLSLDECNKVVTATKSPYRLAFAPNFGGKIFYCFCCWVNNKEEEGTFTPLLTTVIPL